MEEREKKRVVLVGWARDRHPSQGQRRAPPPPLFPPREERAGERRHPVGEPKLQTRKGTVLNAETQRKRGETQRRRTLFESLRTSAPSALNLPSLRLNWGIAVQSKELMLIPATPHRIKDAPIFPLSSRRGRRGPGRGGTVLASRNCRRGNEPPLPSPLLHSEWKRGSRNLLRSWVGPSSQPAIKSADRSAKAPAGRRRA